MQIRGHPYRDLQDVKHETHRSKFFKGDIANLKHGAFRVSGVQIQRRDVTHRIVLHDMGIGVGGGWMPKGTWIHVFCSQCVFRSKVVHVECTVVVSASRLLTGKTGPGVELFDRRIEMDGE